jgi:4-hydroxybenzoate polyprenyltransferase
VYLLVNLFYTLWLKQIIILDVMAIAAGFVLRVIGGAVLVGVQPSSWIIMCTILLSLFLALSKRRYELLTLQGEPGEHRKVLSGYNPYILDQFIAVVTASTVISYALYAITVGEFQIYSVFFVLYGIFRYLYLLHGGTLQGTPTELLLTDRPLLINLLLWGLFLMIDIYFL